MAVTTPLSPADVKNYLGIGKQTVKGTGVAPTYFAAFVEPITFSQDPHIRAIREAGGGSTIARQVKDYVSTPVSFAAPARPDLGAALFAYFFGTAGAPTGSGPYTHTITPTVAPVYLTTERSISDEVIERAIDVVLGGLTYDFRKRDSGPELMLMAEGDGLAQTWQASPTAETYETDRPLLRSDCTWVIDTVANTNVESCTFAFQWRMDDAILADALNRVAQAKLHITCEIELVQIFQSSAEVDAYRSVHYGSPSGTAQSATVYRGSLAVTPTYGAGAAQRQLKLDIPQIDWGEAELTEPDPDASEAVRLTRRGVMVANGASAPATVTAINSKSTAYV